MSYFGCIELEGNEHDITVQLAKLFPSVHKQLTPNAKMFRSGQFEGQCLIYKPNTNECLTPISFMWMPTNDDRQHKLWLWCHPASYDSLADILVSLFDNSTRTDTDEPPSKKSKNENEQTSVIVRLLRNQQQLARFRLIGPLSLTILRHALHPSALPAEHTLRSTAPLAWWSHEAHPSETHQLQVHTWNHTLNSSTSTIMPNRIISLVVRDPRIFTSRNYRFMLQQVFVC
jgi:hypothetical protein